MLSHYIVQEVVSLSFQRSGQLVELPDAVKTPPQKTCQYGRPVLSNDTYSMGTYDRWVNKDIVLDQRQASDLEAVGRRDRHEAHVTLRDLAFLLRWTGW